MTQLTKLEKSTILAENQFAQTEEVYEQLIMYANRADFEGIQFLAKENDCNITLDEAAVLAECYRTNGNAY